MTRCSAWGCKSPAVRYQDMGGKAFYPTCEKTLHRSRSGKSFIHRNPNHISHEGETT